MKVLYLNGTTSGDPTVTTQQLARIAPQLQITAAATVEEAVTEIRRGGWHGLLTPPSMSEQETLTLVTKLRQDRVPVAIVPVVTEWRQEFFAAAVTAGADDVLLVRGETAVHAAETLTRIKQSPHLVPAEERRLRVLYVGKDTLVWNLLEQVPFVKAERTTSSADGALAGRGPATGPDPLRADTIVVDDQPGDAPALSVIKSIRAQAPDLPIVVLTAANAGEAASGVLDLGVDDCIPKTGIYRRRLIASLTRIHQRHDLAVQHVAIKAREARLRQIVENLPEALAVVSADGTLLALNGAGLPLVGASKPGDVVGRDFCGLVAADQRAEVQAFLARVTAGERGQVAATFDGLDRTRRSLQLDGVLLERDARGARGVVVVLRNGSASGASASTVAAAELQSIRDQAEARLAELTDELQKLQGSHAVERTAWDVARAKLEERLQELLSEAEVRQALEMRLTTAEAEARELHSARQRLEADLASARAEVVVTTDAHTAERAEWDSASAQLKARLAQLQERVDAGGATAAALDTAQAALRDAAGARDELANRLEAARDELRQAVQEHVSERAGWETLRRTLESRVEETHALGDVRAELETRLGATRAELASAQRTVDAASAELSAARAELDTVRNELDLARADQGRERGDLDQARSALEAARAELRHRVEEHLADRDAWDAARFQLEGRLEDAQRSAVARVEVEARLEAARTDLRQAADTLAAERAGWDATRRQLEARLHETQAAAGARSELEAELDAARGEVHRLVETMARERGEWEITRRAVEQQLQDARQAHAADRDAWNATHRSLEERVASAAGAEATRRRLEDALQALQAQHAAYVETHAVDRAAHEREHAEVEALRTAVDEERARRSKLEDALLAARSEADDRLAALEAAHFKSRRALQASIEDADVRAARASEHTHAVKTKLETQLGDTSSSRDRLVRSRLFGYALMTLDGRLVQCNDAFAALFGYRDSREALARSADGPFPAMAAREELDARLLAERTLSRFESCLERIDGTTVNVIESAAIVPAPASLAEAGAPAELVERIVVDLNGSSALEDRLRQARRLEEVGTLAAAMAPDIESLLSAIDESGARRAIELVRQLQAFSRRQVQVPAPVDLNDAVRRAEPVLTRLVGAHVEFEIRLGKADGVAASEDDLDQLLTTLVVTGRDLLPVGGALVVETTRLDFEQDGDGTGSPIGPGVVLSVTATGYGVQPVQQASAVEVVARRCGGDVRFSEELGRRAAMQVYFPRCARVETGRQQTTTETRNYDLQVDSWSWTPD